MSAGEMPTASGIAFAWLRCGMPNFPRTGTFRARVTVIEAVSSVEPVSYFRRAPNPGSAADIGRTSSGANFASFSASSYST